MSNIIGLNTKLFGLEKNIKQSEPTRAANDLEQLGDPAGKERVLNPIVSESYMKKYIEEHSGGGGGGSDYSTAEVTILNPSELPYNLAIPNIKEAAGQRPAMLNSKITINQASTTIIVPLYKGACYVSITYLTNVFGEVTGQVSKISGTELFIEGNGTVTLLSE